MPDFRTVFGRLRAETPFGKLTEAEGMRVVLALCKMGGRDGFTFKTGRGSLQTASAAVDRLAAIERGRAA